MGEKYKIEFQQLMTKNEGVVLILFFQNKTINPKLTFVKNILLKKYDLKIT